ncbi:MAG TPA: hypothetical protein VD994_09965 [Prosthecobacter sp.]|nr:hypothetical protein [Prosthecobacter sp.]
MSACRRGPKSPTNDQLIATVRASLGDLEATRLELQLAEAAKLHPTSAAQWQAEIRQRYLRRMWDISLFMKTLKQRFTQWFNRVHQRKGTLWEDRFKSVLVQSAGEPLRAIAAYIDLNPIRAALVEDPQDYPWSSYGAALAGDPQALTGLREIEAAAHAGADPEIRAAQQKAQQDLPQAERDQNTLATHRVLLYGRGEERGIAEDGSPLKKGFSREEARRIVAEGGRLPQTAYLRCRIRYFTEGAVIGDRHFVNAIFQSQRHRHGPTRKTGARLMAGLSKDEKLYALRDLKRQAVA